MPKAEEINTRRMFFPEKMTEDLSHLLEYPLTVVEAPMGYGKTTAIREYLKRTGINVLWIRVYNNHADVFWRIFAAHIGTIDEECSKCLLSLGFPNDAVTLHEILSRISGITVKSKTVIIIDDYHFLDSTDLNTFFECLAENTPPNLHIILTARYTRFLRIDELSLKGSLNHITKETFELSYEDILKYFHICGIHLRREQAQKLYKMTEGWISALKLLMLAYMSSGHFSTAESIYKLVETAVYLPLSKESKEFLLTMCLFDSFTLEQAKCIWGDNSAARILSELVHNSSFVTYERSLGTYTIHRIFLDFLREELDKSGSYILELYGKVAHWFLKSGEYQEARGYCFLCGDFDCLMTALEIDTTIDYSASDKDEIKKYMAACPEEIKAHHHLAMLKTALPMFIHNEKELFGKICEELEKNIDKDTCLTSDMRNSYKGELELLKGLASFNELHRMSSHYKRAWELLKRPTSIYCKKIHWNFGSPSILYLYHREIGKLKSNASVLKEGLPLYNKLTDGHGAGGGFMMEAEYYFNKGDFENAEISLREAVLAARSSDESNILLCTEFLQIRLDFIRGNNSAVFTRLSNMRAIMADRKLYNYLHTVELCEGFVFSWMEDLTRLPNKLLEADPKTLRLGFPAIGMYHILLGRALLIRGEYLKLIGSYDYFNSAASVFPNIMGTIYNDIHMAAANHMISRHDEALRHLEKALYAAIPDKMYMPFAENCDYIEQLLKELSSDARYREDICEILRLGKAFRSGKERMRMHGLSDACGMLSKRELEIARLASTGLSNKEIGSHLFISENTVKSAMKSVYSKLSVNNRIKLKECLNAIDQIK